jgi:hypothetical protein
VFLTTFFESKSTKRQISYSLSAKAILYPGEMRVGLMFMLLKLVTLDQFSNKWLVSNFIRQLWQLPYLELSELEFVACTSAGACPITYKSFGRSMSDFLHITPSQTSKVPVQE